MFIDASALLAILLREEDADQIADEIEAATERITSPIALFEVIAGIMRERAAPRSVAEESLEALLTDARISIVDITAAVGRIAVDAFDRYGKGRGHPARLNMGDCFAYACARANGTSLLYNGDDFAKTDLA